MKYLIFALLFVSCQNSITISDSIYGTYSLTSKSGIPFGEFTISKGYIISQNSQSKSKICSVKILSNGPNLDWAEKIPFCEITFEQPFYSQNGVEIHRILIPYNPSISQVLNSKIILEAIDSKLIFYIESDFRFSKYN